MQIDLTGKTALVTGSSAIGGIGYMAALGLHTSGATVAINGRCADRVQAAVNALGAGDRVIGITADVSTAAGCETLIGAVPRVDILVNNAGGATPQPMMEISDAEWENQFAFNVMSGLQLSRNYLPGMAERGWGRVVFVSSDAALNIPVESLITASQSWHSLALRVGSPKHSQPAAAQQSTVCCRARR